MDGLLYLVQWGGDYCYCCCCCCYYYYYYYKCYGLECCQSHSYRALYKNLGLKLLHSSMQTSADYRSRRRHVSKQASLFAQLINKAIISMNNVQGQAARIAHKAQHCWPPCIKNLTKKTNKHIHVQLYDWRKRWDLVSLRNVKSVEQARVSSGRLFHARAAATGKSPRVARRVDGTCSVVVSAERRHRQATISDVMSAAGCQTGTPVLCHAHNGTLEYTTGTGFVSGRVTSEAPVVVGLCVLTSSASRQAERRHSARTAVGPAGIQRYPQGPSYTDPTWWWPVFGSVSAGHAEGETVARYGLCRAAAHQAPPRCTKCNSPPNKASVPITVLLYNDLLLCGLMCPLKG